MSSQYFGTQQRTLKLAHEFLEETRTEIARAAVDGMDLPARIRTVHDRTGHASPEYRTLFVPIPAGAEGSSPEVLSGAIASFAARRPPSCLLLSLDVLGTNEQGEAQPLLIAEARDRAGTRMFLIQPFDIVDNRITWREPIEGGWRDPGDEEMILDAAFAPKS